MGDGESFWIINIAGDGGGGEERLIIFEFGVLVFEIGFGSELHLLLFFWRDSF